MKNLLIILILIIGLNGFTQPYSPMYILAGQSSGGGGTTLKTGLISVWEFQETSGTTATDAHDSNDGTYKNGMLLNQTGTGNFSKSIKSDGVNDYVSTGKRLITTYPFSISAWVKPVSNTQATYILNTNSYSSRYYGAYCYLRTSGSGGSGVGFGDGTGIGAADRKSYYYGTTVTSGTWYHVVVTVNGFNSSDIKFYLDGVSQTLSSTSGTATHAAFSIYGETSMAGNNWTYGAYEDGNFIQIGLWDKILTSDEISDLNNSGNGLAYINW